MTYYAYCENPFVSLEVIQGHSFGNTLKNHDDRVFLQETSHWINLHSKVIFELFGVQVSQKYILCPYR